MNKIVIFCALSFFASTHALAHVEPGKYVGVNLDGVACEFEVTQVSFVEDFHHPLHERVDVVAAGEKFTLSHVSIVDEATGTVRFSHDRFTGVRGFATGSLAAIMTMDHSEGSDGPSSIRVMRDDYSAANQDSDWICAQLKHVE